MSDNENCKAIELAKAIFIGNFKEVHLISHFILDGQPGIAITVMFDKKSTFMFTMITAPDKEIIDNIVVDLRMICDSRFKEKYGQAVIEVNEKGSDIKI